ncbi:MAG: ABC transporter ATP-binding protein [Defluviitaleaceae bacterium]|nr:ABC transporter ATP-binding protein [Defluviitaleaceae bacterium]
MNDTVLSLQNVNKKFGQNRILNGLNIDIYRGEFVTLLGESGCGKTTTLRLVAGLEQLDSGNIVLDGADVGNMPPDKRNVNTVFQNYALFPHMSVFDNIAYGPKVRGITKQELKTKVLATLELVRMTGYEKRMPHQLSGGQRQRVAIARALINKPLILLLDEPLGALDQKLRQHMQGELKSIQEQAGVTFVYVTHDQDEALNMSDRIGVMRGGTFLQIGTPREIYEEPRDLFVAEFIGERNIIPVKVAEHTHGNTTVHMGGSRIIARKNEKLAEGAACHAAILADRAVFTRDIAGIDANVITARVVSTSYTGSRLKTTVETNDEITLTIIEYGSAVAAPLRAKVYIAICPEDIILL